MQHLLSEISKVPDRPKTLNSDITEALCAFCKQRSYLIKEVEKISYKGEITATLHEGSSAHCYLNESGSVSVSITTGEAETTFPMYKINHHWREGDEATATKPV